MHDHFWGLVGRKDWYEPEPARMIFLGSFFVRLGQKLYGLSWDGLPGKPCPLTATPLQREIAQAAASASIDTFVLNPKTYEFQAIPRKGWRNPKSIAARFSRCRIDAADPANADAEGHHHGLIYVELDAAKRYLNAVSSSASHTVGNTLSTDHQSTYLRFLIHVAQSEKIDEDRLGTAKALQRKIIEMREPWRRAYGNVTAFPPRNGGFLGGQRGSGAGSGNRTRVFSLEGCCTTIVLYPPAAQPNVT